MGEVPPSARDRDEWPLARTTLMYTILWTPGTGVSGWDWLWIGIAFVLDLGHYGYSAYGNRDQLPGMSSSS